MKPVVLLAQSKELLSYIKSVQDLSQHDLLEISKKLLKMQMEVMEILDKFE